MDFLFARSTRSTRDGAATRLDAVFLAIDGLHLQIVRVRSHFRPLLHVAGGVRAEEDDTGHHADALAVFFPASTYLWACGEKAEPSDDDVTTIDIVIGWLTLAVRGVRRSFIAPPHKKATTRCLRQLSWKPVWQVDLTVCTVSSRIHHLK